METKTNQRVIMMFETKGNVYLHVMLEMKGLRLRGITLLVSGMWVLDLSSFPGILLDSKERKRLFEGERKLGFERKNKSVVFLFLILG